MTVTTLTCAGVEVKQETEQSTPPSELWLRRWTDRRHEGPQRQHTYIQHCVAAGLGLTVMFTLDPGLDSAPVV